MLLGTDSLEAADEARNQKQARRARPRPLRLAPCFAQRRVRHAPVWMITVARAARQVPSPAESSDSYTPPGAMEVSTKMELGMNSQQSSPLAHPETTS